MDRRRSGVVRSHPDVPKLRVRMARVGISVAAGAFLLWLGLRAPAPDIRHGIAGGYDLPAFQIPALSQAFLDGDTTLVSSVESEGDVRLITFWASWCFPCLEEQPSLLALQEEFGDEGLTVLGILHDDSPFNAVRWLTANGRLDFRSLVDDDAIAREVGVGGLPHTLLVDRNGRVVEKFLGYWSERDAYVRERVMELLDEEV